VEKIMDEQRQQAYLKLVQALLQCESGQEEALLEARPDLVDEGLVAAVLAVVQIIERESDLRAAETIEWLRDFAAQLTQKLGLELGEEENKQADKPQQANELLDLIKQFIECRPEEQSTVLAAHLNLINEELLRMLLICSHYIKQEANLRDTSKIESLDNLIAMAAAYLEIDSRGELKKDEYISELIKQEYIEALEDLPQYDSVARCEAIDTCIDLTGNRSSIPSSRLRSVNMRSKGNRPKNKLKIKCSTDHILGSIQSFFILVMQLVFVSLWNLLRNDSEPSSNSQGAFLIKALQSIGKGKGTPEFMYSLFRDNLLLINEDLIPLLEKLHRRMFSELNEFSKQAIAANLNIFADLIQLFPLGNRSANLEIAISSYQLVLEAFSRESYPLQWASVHISLANTYEQRVRGGRAANLEKSISGYHSSLQVFSREVFPENWATAQNNLAGVYLNRIQGSRAINIEQSIVHCYFALEIFTSEHYPYKWAATQNNLAVAYLYRIQGERAINLEESITYFHSALEIFNQSSFPEEWAKTQLNLANVYANRIRGERAENLEKSIAYYQLALDVYTYEACPQWWAMAQMGIANTYVQRTQGERAENVEKSIACYQLALDVYTYEAYPQWWATTQMNLANAYRDRIRGEKAANLEDSIVCCYLALGIFNRDLFPEDWAKTKVILGGAYLHRIREERWENQEKSIACFHKALEVFTRKDFPEQWALVQMNLGVAYQNRIRGRRIANLSKSIACYQLALEIRSRDTNLEDWAITQMNLAGVCQMLILGGQTADLEGSFLQKILEKAMNYNRLALDVFTHETYPEKWAMIQENIAILYAANGQSELAITYFQQALIIFQPEAFPVNALKANRELGNIFFKQGHWQLAIDSYNIAIQAVETSRGWSTSEDERQHILREALSVYENTIQAHINLGQIELAIETSERARSRQLVDFMATNDLYLNAEIPLEVRQHLAAYEDLQKQIQAEQVSSENPDDSLRLTSSIRSRATLQAATVKIAILEAQKQIVWRSIRRLDPTLAAQQQVSPIDLATIQQLATTNTAIFSFYTTNDDTHIFIITADSVKPTLGKRPPQIHTCIGQGLSELQVWLQKSWLAPYTEDRINWIGTITQTLQDLADRLQLSALIAQLPTEITELIIIPHLYLHQIPFSALPLANGTLGDKFTIRYAPSCQILQFCTERLTTDKIQHGTIENADGTLPGATIEGQYLATLYQIPDQFRLQGHQATIANFQTLLKDPQTPTTTLHIASHASSRLDNPLENKLILADGSLTLDRLMLNRYPHLQEIFLSCCETNLGTTEITDDLLTLATGFLCAGARSVISTLWAVDDIATAMFSRFYYQNRSDGHSRAHSLQMAQTSLRSLTGAAFQLDYSQDLKLQLNAYANANKAMQINLAAQLDRNEIDRTVFDRKIAKLRNSYSKAFTLAGLPGQAGILDRFCQQAHPFADPYYWAGFTCQGLS
jgi:CHAT domain-containing protein